jgi:hypothetical protein
MTKPGIERQLFLAVGFSTRHCATVDSKELYATTVRRMVKVDIYIHRTKAACYKRHETISKKKSNNCMTKPGIERLTYCFLQWELNPPPLRAPLWLAKSFTQQPKEGW